VHKIESSLDKSNQHTIFNHNLNQIVICPSFDLTIRHAHDKQSCT